MINMLITLVSCSKPFGALDISGCFTYYGVHDLSKHTGEWNSIHVLLLICVHEHRFLQTTFHRDLGKNILPGVFILNYFSIMSTCNVGFSMINHLLSAKIIVLNTNAILAQVLQVKTIS